MIGEWSDVLDATVSQLQPTEIQEQTIYYWRKFGLKEKSCRSRMQSIVEFASM